MKIMLLVIILLALTACASHKQNIVYTSSAYNSWQGAIMNKCAQESVKLTLKIYEGQLEVGKVLTGRDVNDIERFVMESCLKHYGLFI